MNSSVAIVRGMFVLLFLAAVLGEGVPSHAILHEGDGFLLMGDDGGWDFSAFSYVDGPEFPNADIYLRVMLSPSHLRAVPTTDYLSGWGLQYAPLDVDFDSLSVAPDNGYFDTVVANQWRCYFVRTKEGHYAKIQLLQFDGYTWPFRYVYQDDGSTVLPVSQSTWGRIKAMYGGDE